MFVSFTVAFYGVVCLGIIQVYTVTKRSSRSCIYPPFFFLCFFVSFTVLS